MILEDQRALLREQLESLLEPGEPVALVDYPHHENVGDCTIWLGERRLLEDLGHPVRYVCDLRSYSPRQLEQRLPEGAILLHGGGNLGDLWASHQDLREAVIERFAHRRIVQLPQTITFQDERRIERFARVARSHPGLTIMVRDRRSKGLADEHFGGALLSPDCASWLRPQRPATAIQELVWLSRTDHEAVGSAPGRVAPVAPVDWIGKRSARPAHVAVRESTRLLDAALRWRRTLPARHAEARIAIYDRLAKTRYEHGLRMLGSGSVVVTDRLHGHILAALLGLPQVVLDSRFGKVLDYHATWTADLPHVRSAVTVDEAFAKAGQLAKEVAQTSAAHGELRS